MDLRGTISRALSSKRSARVAIAYRDGDVITERGEATGIFARAYYGAEAAFNTNEIMFDWEENCYEVNSFVIKTNDGKVCSVAALDEARKVGCFVKPVFQIGHLKMCSEVFDQLDKIGDN